jgi:hypothetical protein
LATHHSPFSKLPSSYRDRDGFIFKHYEKYYRCIKHSYHEHFQHLLQSGLYKDLCEKKWLLSHTEITEGFELAETCATIILPEQISLITYPYEWSFLMWQDAALMTLQIAKESLDKGMMLKDATPFNIQFVNGSPIFIDTLSFEKYTGEKPWIAYRQFCECFLAPILLQQYCHAEAGKYFMVYPDGIPLEILISMLPKRAKWNLHTYLHIYLQADIKITKRKDSIKAVRTFSKQKMLLLLNGLISYVSKLRVKKSSSAWDNYYAETILSEKYLQEKTRLVQSFLSNISFSSIIDLGANDGHFSLLYKNTGKQIVAVDGDTNCINELYLKIHQQKITNILPLVNTLHTPSPAIGWNNAERTSFGERVKADVVLALALVHHLAIAGNVPLEFIADWLSAMGKYLLIEFVPKTDAKVQLLLQNRVDIFDEYTVADFEQVFSKKYKVLLQEKIAGTDRILYLMEKI